MRLDDRSTVAHTLSLYLNPVQKLQTQMYLDLMMSYDLRWLSRDHLCKIAPESSTIALIMILNYLNRSYWYMRCFTFSPLTYEKVTKMS